MLLEALIVLGEQLPELEQLRLARAIDSRSFNI